MRQPVKSWKNPHQLLAEMSHKEFNKKWNEMRKLGKDGAANVYRRQRKTSTRSSLSTKCLDKPRRTITGETRPDRQLSCAPLIEILGCHQSKEQRTSHLSSWYFVFPMAILSVTIVGPFESLAISFRWRLVGRFVMTYIVLVSNWIEPAAKTESK